jgi:hypothetical protein
MRHYVWNLFKINFRWHTPQQASGVFYWKYKFWIQYQESWLALTFRSLQYQFNSKFLKKSKREKLKKIFPSFFKNSIFYKPNLTLWKTRNLFPFKIKYLGSESHFLFYTQPLKGSANHTIGQNDGFQTHCARCSPFFLSYSALSVGDVIFLIYHD